MIIYPVLITKRVERYLCISNENTYNIRFDILKDIWTCSCPNVRNCECKHIRETKKYRDGK